MRALIMIMLLIAMCHAAHCEGGKVAVLPLTVFDGDGKRSEGMELLRAFMAKLGEHYFGGRVEFVRERNAGEIVSVADAATYCAKTGNELLLYGYVRRSENSLRTEIRLFSARENKVEKFFFGMDSSDNGNRLMGTVASHVAEYFYERAGIEREEENDNEPKMSVAVFAKNGWWMHYLPVFNNRLIGVIDMSAGVDLKPGNLVKTVKGRNLYIWFRFETGFKYAMGSNEVYPANYYSLRFAAPAVIGVQFDRFNSLSIGIGPSYELEIMNYRKKYEEPDNYYASLLAGLVLVEYMFSLNKNIAFTAGVDVNFAATDNAGKWLNLRTGFEYTF